MTSAPVASDKPVLLDSQEGQKLVLESLHSHWPAMKPHARKQLSDTTCGLASAAIILQALAAGRTNAKFHEMKLLPLPATHKAAHSVTWKQVQTIGLTYLQVATVLEAHGAQVTVHSADGCSLGEFRKLALTCLLGGGFINANFLQKGMGYDAEGGHHSPLVAYHKASDRFLLLDVWKHYPHAWFTTQQLWDAINTVDSDSKLHRGFVLVSQREAAAKTADASAALAADSSAVAASGVDERTESKTSSAGASGAVSESKS